MLSSRPVSIANRIVARTAAMSGVQDLSSVGVFPKSGTNFAVLQCEATGQGPSVRLKAGNPPVLVDVRSHPIRYSSTVVKIPSTGSGALLSVDGQRFSSSADLIAESLAPHVDSSCGASEHF